MTNELLMRLFDHLVADARKTMAGKNHDYTAASQDALANFKTVAETLGLKPRQVWAVYFMKHVMAVLAWAKTGKVESEGMTGRFVDLVNYAAIGNALLQEPEKGSIQEALAKAAESLEAQGFGKAIREQGGGFDLPPGFKLFGQEAVVGPAVPGPYATVPNALDFPALWDDQSAWSQKTFGTDQERGPQGSLKHLIKEAQEALQKPDDHKEYADLIILVCDASRRAGLTMGDLLKAAHAKMAENKKRTWPKPVEGEPCEHVKGELVNLAEDWVAAADPTPRPKSDLEPEALDRLKVGQGFFQNLPPTPKADLASKSVSFQGATGASAEWGGEPRPGGGSRPTVTEEHVPVPHIPDGHELRAELDLSPDGQTKVRKLWTQPKTPPKYVGEPGPGSEGWGEASA